MPIITGDTVPLYSYQEMPRAFMRREGPDAVRGLLIYHALGAGKTLTAIGIAETSGRKAICLLPARLKSEFLKELKKYGRPEFRPPADWDSLSPERKAVENKRLTQNVLREYSFISYNSQNVARDLRMVGDLNSKILIIDEVHTLLARIVSPSAKIGDQVYQMIMASPGLRIVALSGTPAISDPFELSVLFNMLRGRISLHPATEPGEEGHITGSEKIKEGKDTGAEVVSLPKPEEEIGSRLTVGGKKKDVSHKKNKTSGGRGPRIRGDGKTTLFPQDYREFSEYFVDRENNRIKNRKVFQDRITGLVSYYPGLWDPDGSIIPRRTPLELVTVRMSEYQWNIYVSRRRQELDTERRDKFNTKAFTYSELKKPKRQSTSTYKQGSIQASLFVPPDYVNIPSKKELAGHTESEIRKIRAKAMDGIHPRDLQLPALEEFSCKFADVLRKLEARPRQITFIFSSLDVMGVGALSRVLDANGWQRFRRPEATRVSSRKPVVVQDVGVSEEEMMSALEEPDVSQQGGSQGGGKKLWKSMRPPGTDWEGDEGYPGQLGGASTGAPGMTYAVVNGDTSEEEKAQIIEAMTGEDNVHGGRIRVLLGTKVIAEGVDLKCVKTVIFLEAQWKRIRTDQVIGRAVRLNSHMLLPIEERDVEIFMYNAEPAEGVRIGEALPGDTESVDMQLYRKSNDEGRLLDTFFVAIRETSIDCRLNIEATIKKFPDAECRSCLPTGRDLIVPDVRQHILNGTRCETSKNVALRKVLWQGQEYREDREGNLYRYDTRLQGWARDDKLTKRWQRDKPKA